MPSSPAVRSREELDTLTQPIEASVSLVERMASPPQATVTAALSMVLESLPLMPWLAAVTASVRS